MVILTTIFACSNSKKDINDLNEIELGMSVEKVVEKLNLELNDLHIIQEPPLIFRGIHATLSDSTRIGISFERTYADPDNLSKDSIMKIIADLKIKGFAWKKANGEGKIIGTRPQFWID